MITNYPYSTSSYYRYYPQYSYYHNHHFKRHNYSNVNIENDKQIKKTLINNDEKKETPIDNRQYFDIFGIKLYFDDILLISLIFFLYNEGLQDQNLFVCLILLLLS